MTDERHQANTESAFEQEPAPTLITPDDDIDERRSLFDSLLQSLKDSLAKTIKHGLIHPNCDKCWNAETRHYW